mmetsp:Transcript_46684/g.117472  ORF Transcript_46684/g.117472 Transcript_46684/m.117472 type:complete len:270 (-) Transcript_46684:117-926(-)
MAKHQAPTFPAFAGAAAALAGGSALAATGLVAAGLPAHVERVVLHGLPPDVWAELVFSLAATAAACTIDARALSRMFLEDTMAALNWAAGAGVVCSVLKLSLEIRVTNYEALEPPSLEILEALLRGELQLNALVRGPPCERRWEAVYGNMCIIYLATYFSVVVMGQKGLSHRQLVRRAVLYAFMGLPLAAFSGYFSPAVGGEIGWLMLLHVLALTWACCWRWASQGWLLPLHVLILTAACCRLAVRAGADAGLLGESTPTSAGPRSLMI